MTQDIQLLGQRCSGTNHLRRLLETNFDDVQIVDRYANKHLWNGDYDFEQDVGSTIFVTIVRNPYDWLRSVHRTPYHCPDLVGTSFTSFLRAPWTAWAGEDWFSHDPAKRNAMKVDDQLIEACADVMQVRRRKIATFLKINAHYQRSSLVRLEDLQRAPQTELTRIASEVGLEAPNTIREVKQFKDTNKLYQKKPLLKIGSSNLVHIIANLDWASEGQLGYSAADYKFDSHIPWYRYEYLARQLVTSLRNRGAD